MDVFDTEASIPAVLTSAPITTSKVNLLIFKNEKIQLIIKIYIQLCAKQNRKIQFISVSFSWELIKSVKWSESKFTHLKSIFINQTC